MAQLDATDPMTNSTWVGDTVGMYADETHSQGIVFVQVGPDGRYEAHGYYRGEKDCMEALPSWTGRLLRISRHIYAAVNDGADGPFYVLNVDTGFDLAVASLVAKNLGHRLIERNQLFRHPQKAADKLEAILRLYGCGS
jgi:hypothetical protein